MKKILLCSINARFSHTNLAIRYLRSYITQKAPSAEAVIREWTIQQPLLDIIRDISEENPDLVLFSVYIWNRELSFKVMGELKKLFPNTPIGAGGPEVSWQAERLFRENPVPDFIVQGEGEETVAEIAASLAQGNLSLQLIPGIWYRNGEHPERALFSGERRLIEDLDAIPFPYELAGNLPEDAPNRIIYYESARGCPFRCAYCLSSIDRSVRYFSLERVIRDLDFFLEKRLPLVKFVDRTFNLDPERYAAIWE
ncbi:MAG: cobalamin-dependent protein, partial [Spirochaetaceae bacterium]|nr:cobalamin-dependent protein [Spirochaetaceae bacterium]